MGIFDGKKFDFQSAVSKIQDKIVDIAQPTGSTDACSSAEQQANTGKVMFCSNCGTKLNSGAKFCHGCGAAVGAILQEEKQVTQAVSSLPQTAPLPQSAVQSNCSERQQEYAGKILKCPNCGGQISETTAICPDCGMRITGKTATSSVQTFKDQLINIESQRKKSVLGMLNIYSAADPVDKQKLELIKNYPIPNTVDDILEFLFLAIANIDVKLSKRSWVNSSSDQTLALNMPKVISDAWVSKMQQAYQKAEIMFPNDTAFTGIQNMYYDKMKELKIKVK